MLLKLALRNGLRQWTAFRSSGVPNKLQRRFGSAMRRFIDIFTPTKALVESFGNNCAAKRNVRNDMLAVKNVAERLSLEGRSVNPAYWRESTGWSLGGWYRHWWQPQASYCYLRWAEKRLCIDQKGNEQNFRASRKCHHYWAQSANLTSQDHHFW